MKNRWGLLALILLALPVIATDATARASVHVDAVCPNTAIRGATVGVTLQVDNRDTIPVVINRGLLAIHLGNLSVIGPTPFTLSVTLPVGPSSIGPISVAIPTSARLGTSISVVFGLLGPLGAGPSRELKASGQCFIEITG
jgi:hypothetical protein